MTEVSTDAITTFMREQIASLIKSDVTEIDPDTEFINFGIDSIHALFLIDGLERKFKVEVNPLYFWECPTIRLLAKKIGESQHKIV